MTQKTQLRGRPPSGSVWRKNGKIYARLQWTDETGRRRSKCQRATSVSEARAIVRDQLRAWTITGQSPVWFADLATEYERVQFRPAQFAQNRKISGLKNLSSPRTQLRACVEYFGTWRLIDLTYGALVAFKQARAARLTAHGRAPSIITVHRELERLRAVLNFAVQRGWLDKNPFAAGPPLINKSVEPLRQVIPTEAEINSILSQCHGRRAHLFAVLVVLRDTGLRPAELWRLCVSDVDLTRRLLTVHARNAKSNRSRLVGLTVAATEALRGVMERGQLTDSQLVFNLSGVRRSFATACRLAGVTGVTLYAWRHLAATELTRAGVPLAIAMATLGHSEQRTFRRYLTIEEETAREAAEQLELYRQSRG